MRRALRCLSLVLCVACATAHAADSESARHLRISDILFPEARGWQAFDSLPAVGEGALLAERAQLRSIYLDGRKRFLMEDPACSVSARVLYQRLAPDAFRLVDVDGDAYRDIVYSGPAMCAEGNAFIVWFGSPNGPADRDVLAEPFLALRVEEKEPRRVSGVVVGCCADPIDVYLLGGASAPAGIARIRVPNTLVIPGTVDAVNKPYRARREIALGADPTVNDSRDGGPAAAAKPVYWAGSTYPRGSTGRLMAVYRDAHGDKWGLVAMEDRYRKAATSGRQAPRRPAGDQARAKRPRTADAGWVLMD